MSEVAARRADTVAPVFDASDETVALIAKALGHPARIRIVRMLLAKHSCIGCDIVDEVGLAQSTVSEHLRLLKAAGVIVGEVERPRVCYSLNRDALMPLAALLNRVFEADDGGELGGFACCPPSGGPRPAADDRERNS